MKLTISSIQEAITYNYPAKGDEFWLDPKGEKARIVEEATKRGYLRRFSHTQVEWSEEGLKRARREIPEDATREYTIEVEIPEAWFERGYELTPARMEELLCQDRPYTDEDGPKVKLADGTASKKAIAITDIQKLIRETCNDLSRNDLKSLGAFIALRDEILDRLAKL